MKHLNRLVCLLLVIPLVSSVARANASRLPSQDGWAVARGYAVVAGIGSSSSIYYNPAGLSQLTADEVRSGVYVVQPEISFSSASTGATVDEQSSAFYQPHFFAAMPVGSGFTLGAGLYSPFGQSTKWPTTSGFAGLATFNEIKYVTGALSCAYKISKDLSIGASAQYSHARVNLNRLTALAPGVVTNFGYQGEDSALSANFGLQWSPMAGQRFGIQYQRKTDFHFTGTATLAGVLSQPGQLGWVFPDDLSVGWQWDIQPDWQAEVSVDRTDWSRVKTLQLRAGPLSTAVPLQWKSSSYYGVGVTHGLNASWSVNAGYNYSENSVPDATFAPSLPDVSRHLLNGGVFWSHSGWELGLVVQRGLQAHRTIAGPAPDGLGGSEAGTFRNALWAGELSAAVRF